MKAFAVLTAWALWVLPLLSLAEGVRYRGIFVNDEDWGLRPWAVRHFGAEEQIGTNAYAEIFALMKANGLNLIWPAMHEGGYEFSARPENLALARRWGIAVGTSHCEPMLRNNCYLSKVNKKKWSWVSNRDFLIDYWREGVRRGMECLGRVEHADRVGDVLWTIGMRGIHDGRMPDGKTTEEKVKILEEVFAAQCAMLPDGAPKLFCPYKEVLPIFNAGLKVPEDATILWVNDNFGYIRRIGGPHPSTHPLPTHPIKHYSRQGIYWHLSYWGRPHGYIHLCTTPPAFMWYELVAKCWENGVRDVWMINAGDVFQAEILLDAFGKFAADPESWGPDAQVRFLSSWADGFLAAKDAKSTKERIAAHLAEYYNLGFNRKPEHMCIQWSGALPESLKSSLLKRYHALLNEDMAIERLLRDSTRLKIADEYFRLVGFQARFLAYAGIIHLEGRDKAYAHAVLDPLYTRWDALDGGKWSGFWIDTIDEKPGMYQPSAHNRWSSQMQWPWNEPDDPARKDRRGESRNDYVATAYAWERAKGLEEPTWIEPVARERGAKGGEWVNVSGLGTSGNALALLPVKPGVGEGAVVKYSLTGFTRLTGLGANENSNLQLESPTLNHVNPVNPVEKGTIVLQFLPDFALWPGLKLGVKVSFDDGEAKYVEVPRSDSNIGEKDSIRAVAVQDNFIRVDVPIPSGAKTATITAVDPGVVIDRVGVRPTRQASGTGERIIPQGANVAPNGDRLDVTSKCLRLNGRALVPIMGEMHYSRIPRDEWAKSLATMREGGVSIVSTYVFWNHHEWKEGEWDFSGNRDLSAFLGEVKKAGLWAVVRIGPWAHGECREGGFPDWLVDKGFEWANGDAKKARQILRSRDARFLGETRKLFERVHSEVASHFWKNGGPVIGVQLENESRGPWPYYQALKKLAVEAGYDVPMYTRTGWPRLNGPETTFGEMIPLYGDYAEGFWDRELKSMPSGYKSAFEMRPARTSSVIATEQLGKQKAEDAKGAEKYPYFTCELGGGMASSYHRRLVMEPLDAFALAVVKLGSGSNLPGFYMYHGGSNPTEYGVNMAESQRGRFTNYNDLPVVSYEFMAPVSEFGEPQISYWLIKALGRFCREYGEELAVEEPVFVNKHETRRGRFVFHNDYVRRLNPDGECWIGIEKDGKVERIVDGRKICASSVGNRKPEVLSVGELKLLKPAGTPPPVEIGPAGVAVMPEESVWDAAAEYEVPFKPDANMIEIAYDGDMARLYADGQLVQDDFWKGRPIRYALRRLPKDTKRLTLKVLPWGEGAEKLIFVDCVQSHPSKVARSHTFEIGESEFLLYGKPFLVRCGEIHYARIPREYWQHRLKMLRAMGCNAVGCYMFWNFHEREKGVFNWKGRADAAAFCRMAQEEGLWVILRPGPYSCAEWEGGGAPWWLMRDDEEFKVESSKLKVQSSEMANPVKPISMRSSDPRWLIPATNWLHAVGRELASLQVTKGGPILMVQVENEYGLHGNDVGYIRALREAVIDAGFEVPLYACNPPRVIQNGFIPELFQAANFGADPEQRFGIVRQYQPKGPLMCAEYYPAWFDTWGQAHHPPKSDRQFFGPIDWMFEHRVSFSLYMAHGGTSFGGWSGCRNPFIPNVTSYDYEAPINEYGSPNPSFAKYRERAAKYQNPGETIPDVPAPIPVKAYGTATLSPFADVAECGWDEERLEHPVYSERLGMGFGIILWSADVLAGVAGDLKVDNLHDFGYVYLDGKRIGILDRRHRGIKIKIPSSPKVRRLNILVEAMGRINSSSGMEDRKGLDGRVFVGKTEIKDWEYELEPIDPDGQENPPGNWRGTFAVDEIADTFVDMRAFNKGIVWVNGKNLGRYWKIGPQQTLYLPGCWLKKGQNEIVVREMLEPMGKPTVAFLDHPILDELHTEADFNIVKREHDKFVGGDEVASGAFPNSDAAQVVMLEKPVRGTFFTLQVLSTYDANNLASIAEFDFLGADGNPLTSVDMQISGVDSEEEVRDDGVAENAIDGQVEAYWLSSSRTLPHWIEFRVSDKTQIHGFRYTPRQGNGIGRIKDWKLHVR